MQFVVLRLKQKGDQYVHSIIRGNPSSKTLPSLFRVGEMGMHRIDSGAVLEEQGKVMGAPSAAVDDGVSYPYLYLDKCGPPEEATLSCGPLFAFIHTVWTLSPLRLSSFCLDKLNTFCQGFRALALLFTRPISIHYYLLNLRHFISSINTITSRPKPKGQSARKTPKVRNITFC